jgi:hypothetical protein
MVFVCAWAGITYLLIIEAGAGWAVLAGIACRLPLLGSIIKKAVNDWKKVLGVGMFTGLIGIALSFLPRDYERIEGVSVVFYALLVMLATWLVGSKANKLGRFLLATLAIGFVVNAGITWSKTHPNSASDVRNNSPAAQYEKRQLGQPFLLKPGEVSDWYDLPEKAAALGMDWDDERLLTDRYNTDNTVQENVPVSVGNATHMARRIRFRNPTQFTYGGKVWAQYPRG